MNVNLRNEEKKYEHIRCSMSIKSEHDNPRIVASMV